MTAGGHHWIQLPFNGLQTPTAITVDSHGNVFVLNQGHQVVELAAK
jgi:hypothetical protein